ncbi:RDD family protein [Halopiger aswanensis]|uniref:RDD family protein n=1 Tax=Halopiger aswanensis TaxID=148449 RepID=A0A419WJ28_9EURY|nr:RDD family protein [Halopiger aswanensis]RKD95352.1 RDD family protein [Halopiger aswanensis]
MEKYPAPRLGTNGDVIGQRILAFLVDSLLVGLIWGVFVGFGTLLGDVIGALALLVGFAVTIVYAFLLEGLYGYTPGKYLLGLVVVKSDGSNCTIGASILRNPEYTVGHRLATDVQPGRDSDDSAHRREPTRR